MPTVYPVITCEHCGATFTQKDHVKRRLKRFCSPQCRSKFLSGPKSPCWKGGYHISNGYVEVRLSPGKGTKEHRAVMAAHIGRPLTHDEIVHHKDENKTNNDISNLQIVTRPEHQRLHANYNTETEKICMGCNTIKNRTEFHKDSSKWDGQASRCKPCCIAYQKALRRK